MKKTLLTLIIAIIGCTSNAQTLNPTFSINAPGSINSFTGGYTFSYATSGSPWNGALMSFGGFNNNYDCQISTDYGPHGGSHLSFRTRNGDAATWNQWNEIWNSNNLNNNSSDFAARNIYTNGNIGIGTTNAGANLTFKDVNTDAGSSGITWYSAAPLNYGIYRTTGAWNAPAYQQIKVQWDTGIQLDPGSAYAKSYVEVMGGGIRVTGGNVGIGITSMPVGYKLAVAGNAIAESVTVKLQGSWPDYVFKPKYSLPSLATVKSFIYMNQRLPGMPSETEVTKNGINLGEIVKIQTKKIEELTLYLIEKDQKDKEKDKRIAALEKALAKLIESK